MTTLASQLSNVYSTFEKQAPKPAFNTIKDEKANFLAVFDPSKAPQVGDRFPDFDLSNAYGEQVRTTDLLASSAFLITFYRGEWCPFCNLALRDLQKHLDEFKAKNITLIAISPELPNNSLTTIEKSELKFEVLSDVHNKLAHQLNIVWAQGQPMQQLLDSFGHNLPKRNGDESYEVPVPATFLVDQSGIIRNSYVNADYTKRLETTEALKWVDALQG